MTAKSLLEYSMIANVLLSVGVVISMRRRGVLRRFLALATFLTVSAVESTISIAIMYFRKSLGIERGFAYDVYFYSHWICFLVECTLMIFIIYGIFRSAIKPLQGLDRAGTIVFRWVSVVALVLSIAAATGPNILSAHYFASAAGQIQQGVSVLTLCLLLFVCFSIRYLGLTYRSHIFGVSLGLGVLAVSALVESAWFSTVGAQSMYSPIYLVYALSSCVAFSIWGAYFAMPEPVRKMVLLPTTSPYFLWNRISEALGDAPGDVAVAGFKPEMLAEGELQVMTASAKVERPSAVQAVDLQPVAMQR